MEDNSQISWPPLTPEQAGERLDRWVLAHCDGVTRSQIQRWVQQGLVLVNGIAGEKNRKLRAGDRISVFLPQTQPPQLLPQPIPLDILYEDDWLLVVNKPKGMVVHPAAGNPDGTLVNALVHHCGGKLAKCNGEQRPGIVHRIDKDTSGLLVVAKEDAAYQSLAAQIKAHTVERFYEAVVYGHLPQPEGTVDLPIGRSPKDRKKMAVVEGGRPARTHYQALECYRDFTHLRLRLETGRTHQIRVHMAYLGHPVAGDPVYGPRKVITRLGGQCLHAGVLGFQHPVTGEHLSFQSPLPAYFTGFLQSLTPLRR